MTCFLPSLASPAGARAVRYLYMPSTGNRYFIRRDGGNVARVEQPGVRAPAPEALQLVQDLVNTVDLEAGADELRSPADLAAWASSRGLTAGAQEPGGAGEFDAGGLARVLALRELLRDVCTAHAGLDVPPAALRRLDALLRRAPLRLSVDAEGGAAVRPGEGLTGADALTAAVAATIAAAVADRTWPRLKACAAGTCRWVYYDRSPAGRSRWCSMAVCGSRAKMRTYRRNRTGT
jgi:predicted RNA-binding Zn ribbon-like protein